MSPFNLQLWIFPAELGGTAICAVSSKIV